MLDVSQFYTITKPKAQTTSCLEEKNRVFHSSLCRAGILYRHDDEPLRGNMKDIVKLTLSLVKHYLSVTWPSALPSFISSSLSIRQHLITPSIHLSPSVLLSFSPAIYLCISLLSPLSISHMSPSLHLSQSLHVSRSPSINFFLHLHLAILLVLSLSQPIPLYPCLTLFLFLHLSIPLHLSAPLCISAPFLLSIFVHL